MVNTIGNPLSWGGSAASGLGHHLSQSLRRLRSPADTSVPQVRDLSLADLDDALRHGWADFLAMRTDVMYLCFVYPAIGLLLAWFALDADLLPLLFPLVSGFALIGPVAAIGLYQMSRKREAKGSARWTDALSVLREPVIGPILVLAFYLFAIFFGWMLAAYLIFDLTLGAGAATTAAEFARNTLTTPAGYAMIAIGIPVGFLFALLVLAISVVSFPLLLDRDVGLPVAVATSLRVTRRNPVVIATWGVIVTAGLVIGSLPVLLGLVIVLPVLGHATWHLYRRAVVAPDEAA